MISFGCSPFSVARTNDRRGSVSAASIGGASNEAGGEYRRAVGAYFAAHGLNGEHVAGLDLAPGDSAVQAVSLEWDSPVDDIFVELSNDHRAFLQAKRTLDLRTLREVVDQWKRQVCEPDFDPKRDRLVAVSGRLRGVAIHVSDALARQRAERAGKPSQREEEALGKLGALISDLTRDQRRQIFQTAVVLELFVGEERFEDATVGRLLLDGHVVAKGEGLEAWRDLIRIAGKRARAREGSTIDGWLRELRDSGRRLVSDEKASRAGELERRRLALETLRKALVRAGRNLSLRPLGAAIPPIFFEEVDADVKVAPPGSDPGHDRDGHQPLWAIRRRGRVLLTGLPGGGKTSLIGQVVARWARMEAWAIPVSVKLPDVLERMEGQGFTDAIIEVAVGVVPHAERPLVRRQIEEGMAEGRAALFLDGLDETGSERGHVVEMIQQLLDGIHPAVDVVLSTRDVGYAQAHSLGFADLRVRTPREIHRTVEAVVRAIAGSHGLAGEDKEKFVTRRAGWGPASDPTRPESGRDATRSYSSGSACRRTRRGESPDTPRCGAEGDR